MRDMFNSIRIFFYVMLREIADACEMAIPILIIGGSIALCIGLIVLAIVYPIVWTIKQLFF